MAYTTGAKSATEYLDHGDEGGGYGASWLDYGGFLRWWASGAFSSLQWETVQLLLDDATLGNNIADNSSMAGSGGLPVEKTWSGNLAAWGAGSLTPAQSKGRFGIRIRARNADNTSNKSPYLDFYGFDLSLIPTDATITNLSFKFLQEIWAESGSLGAQIYLDPMPTLTVTFDYDPVLGVGGQTTMSLYTDTMLPEYQQTKLRYTAYDKNRQLLGDYTTELGTPSIKRNLNELHSTYTLELAQNDLTEEAELVKIITEASDDWLTEAEKLWLHEISTPVGVGDDTNADTNVEIDISAAYGRWLPWLTEEGDPIIQEDGRLIVIADGFPDGRKIYGGYISSFDLDIGGTNTVKPNLLSHSQELNNILLETESVKAYAYEANISGYEPLQNGSYSGSVQALAQTLIISGGTKKIDGIDVRISVNSLIPQADVKGYGKGEYSATVKIHAANGGANCNSGNLIAQSTVIIKPYGGLIHFSFAEPVTMTDGSTYTFVLTTPNGDISGAPSGYSAPLFVGVDNGGGYASGTGQVDKLGAPWKSATWDIPFQLWEAGGEVIRNFYSMDPSDILKAGLRFAQYKGSRVQFDDDSIEQTGTVVTIKSNANTIDELVSAALKSMPAGWSIWYDPATDYVHAHPRPDTTTRYFKRGTDFVGTLPIRKTIEDLTNDVLYSGGDTGGGDNLLVRRINTESIAAHRRGFKKLSDSRVTVESTAEILADAEIDAGKDPIYRASATIVRTDYPLEDINLAELSEFLNVGRFTDSLPAMQIVSINYKVETVDLEFNLLPPKVAKRVEDIRRNLELQESKDNPVSPL